MEKHTLIGTLALFALVSCSDIESGSPDAPSPISFHAELDYPSRGTTTDIGALRSQGFSVYAMVSTDGEDDSEELYFSPTTYTYSEVSGEWTGTSHFWPEAGKSLDMYFYAPAAAFDSIHHAEREAFFSLKSDVGQQRDLLWGIPKTGLHAADTAVAIDFAHALSRIVLTAYIDNDSITAASGGATVTSVSLSGNFNTSGVADLSATSASSVWKRTEASSATYTPSTITSAITNTDSANPTPLLKSGQELFIIPTDFTVNNLRLTVTLSASGNSYTLKHDIAARFEAGQTYTINIELTKPSAQISPDVTPDPSDPGEDNL